MKTRPFIIAALSVVLSGCGIYSFTGTSIQPDEHTVCIEYFEYKALKVNPSLSNDLTEAVKNQFRRMTRLEQVEMDGDLEISGAITGYEVSATAITAKDMAAQNRLTVSIKVDFKDNKHPENSFDGKTFSQYSDYDATTSLESVESTLCSEIIDKLVDDIFNATVAQW